VDGIIRCGRRLQWWAMMSLRVYSVMREAAGDDRAVLNFVKYSKRIISVSRRTDIPAFYGNWFITRRIR
jgi:hypothetical protein